MPHGARDVEAGVAIEEADGLEHEADRGHWHHRPVLGPDDMVRAEGVPDDEIGVLERGVVLHVARQPGPARMLIRLLARRVPLSGIVAGHPHVLGHEAPRAG
jgi:hypothetical protein